MEFSIDALKFIAALTDKNNFLSVLQTWNLVFDALIVTEA